MFSCMIDAFDEQEEYDKMMEILDGKVNPKTKEKFAFEIRLENKLNRIIAERDEAYDLISLLLSEGDNAKKPELKKKLKKYENILNNYNI